MRAKTSFVTLIVCLSASAGQAVSIRSEGASSSATFEVTYGDLQSPLSIVLQFANDSPAAVTILSWQLIDLQLRPLDGAQGALLFQSAFAPPDSMFGQLPGPLYELTNSGVTLSALDIDPNFIGVPLSPNSSKNVLQIFIEASANARGPFQLVMPEIVDVEADSSWFNPEAIASPVQPFENSAPSRFPGFILLGTIHVNSAPEFPPGDYNRSGGVGPEDYLVWKSEFGNTTITAGDGADGNMNGLIDASDYVIWRKMTGDSPSATGSWSGTPLPESAGIASMFIGLFNSVCLFRRPRQSHELLT